MPLDQSDLLLPKARDTAVSASLVGLRLRSDLKDALPPAFSDVTPAHWDTILTTAGVFVTISRLQSTVLAGHRQDALLASIMDGFHRLQPQAATYLQDCGEMFDRTVGLLAGSEEYDDTPDLVKADALGMWVVANLLPGGIRHPDAAKAIRGLGAVIHEMFWHWWEEDE